MRVDLLIPMKDEAPALPSLFRALRTLPTLLGPAHTPRLVVVDDGSSDGTAALCRQEIEIAPFEGVVVARPQNGGIGAALRSAAAHLRGDAVVTYDADLPYPLEDLGPMLQELGDGADVVTASPWHPEGSAEGVPAGRVGLSKLASLAYRLRFRGAHGPRTWTCGFRAWKRRLFLQCLPRRDGFVATAEMLVRALQAEAPPVSRPGQAFSMPIPRRDHSVVAHPAPSRGRSKRRCAAAEDTVRDERGSTGAARNSARNAPFRALSAWWGAAPEGPRAEEPS